MTQRITLDEARATAGANVQSRWPTRAEKGNRLEPECWPAMRPSFKLKPGARIFTIGSCFARNIEHHLARQGFDIPMLRRDVVAEGEHLTDSLNKYTPASIYQELKWTYDIMQRDGQVREEDVRPLLLEDGPGKFHDLHVILKGHAPLSAVMARRHAIFELFKQAFTSDVVVITLGLVETWWDCESKRYIEDTTVVMRKRANPRFQFERLTFLQCYKFVADALDLLGSTGEKRVLLTTSPVGLTRTFTADDVIVANMYSKSVLRAVAGQLAAERANVDYFPSFESVMLSKEPHVWEDDLRHVTTGFVARIVQRLTETYTESKSDDAGSNTGSQAGSLAVAEPRDRELKLCNLVEVGDISAAADIYRTMGDDVLASESLDFHTHAGLLLKEQGNRPDALAHARKAVALSRKTGALEGPTFYGDQQVRNVDVLIWAGAKEEGEVFLRQLLAAATPHWRAVQLHRLDAVLSPQEMLRLCDENLTAAQDEPITHFLRSNALLALGRKDEALDSVMAALALEPDKVQLHLKLANLLADLGRREEAASALTAAVTMVDPANVQLRRRLGTLLVDAGHKAEGLEHLAESVRLDPRDARGRQVYAQGLRQADRILEAIAEMREALKLDPGNPGIRGAIERFEKQLAVAQRMRRIPSG